jgi:RHS repeat-associated protein
MWVSTFSSSDQAELQPITGSLGDFTVGSGKVVETGSPATGVTTTANGDYALVSEGDGYAGDGYLVSLVGGGSAAQETGATLPDGVAVTPDGDYGFVADGAPLVGALYDDELADDEITALYPPDDSTPEFAGVAACPGGNTVVATDANTGELDILSGVAGGPSDISWTEVPVSVGNTPDGVACADGYAFVTNSSGSTLSTVNLATDAVTAATVGTDPAAVAVLGDDAYVANSSSGTVSVIPIGSTSASGTITVGSDPDAIATDGQYVYVANHGSNSVSVLSGESVAQTVTGLRDPSGIAFGVSPLASNSGPNPLELLGQGDLAEACGCNSEDDINALVDDAAAGDVAGEADEDLGAVAIDALGGDPVNTATGNFTWNSAPTQLTVPESDGPLQFELTYNSALRSQAKPSNAPFFGYGVSAAPELSLELNTPSSGDVTVMQEDGSQLVFVPQSGGACPSGTAAIDPASNAYCAAPRIEAALFNNSGTWTFDRFVPSYRSFTFNSSGTLTAFANAAGATTTITNGVSPGSGTCPTTTGVASCVDIAPPSPSTRTMTLEENSSGEVIAVTDSLSRTVTLTYCMSNTSTCATGDLASIDITSASDTNNRTVTFGYDETRSLNALATVTQPTGYTTITNTYDDASSTDPDFGMVTSQLNALSFSPYTFSYAGLDATTRTGAVIMTDPMGYKTLYQYAYGVLTGEITGFGTISAASWAYYRDSSTDEVTEIIDPDGNSYRYSYDAEGSLTAVEDGTSDSDAISYSNPASVGSSIDPAYLEPTEVVDKLGQTAVISTWNTGNGELESTELDPDYGGGTLPTETTAYFYNSEGELSGVDYPLGGGVVYTFNSDDDVSKVTDVPNYSADHNDLSPSNTEPQTTYSYSSALVSSVVSPDGNVSGCGCAAQYTTSFTYNALDELNLTTYPPVSGVSETETDTYTLRGEPAAQTVTTSASGTVVSETSEGYNVEGWLRSQTSGVGSSVASTAYYTYTADGYLYSTEDGAGNLTTYVHGDPAYPALVTQRTDPVPASGQPTPLTVYSYDGDGNLLTQTNPSGSIVSYAYNPNGQACVEYMGSLTSPSCASPPSGATSYTYDADGRRHTMTDSTGTSTWTDDALDEVTSVQNGADKTLSYGYNVDGDLVCMGYPVSGAATCPVDSTGSGSGIVTYGYDGIDRMTSMTDWLSSPNETHFAYDADSNVTGVTYSSASGATASYVYNGADMMTEASVSVGSGDNPHGAALSDSWGYDPEEQVSSDTDTGADYVYDAQGRLANSNVYYGDSLNDELCWTDTSSTTATCASPPSGSGVETFAYNGDSELTSTTESSGTTDYGYTPDGERCFEGDASGTCSSPPSGALTYGWNALGQMCWSDVTSASTSCGSPPTGATSYDYNGDGLLTTSSSSGSTSLTWDEVGDSLPRIVSDGSKAYLYGPDMFGVGTTQPIEEITLSSSAPAFVFADRVGTKLLLSSLGVVNASFSYSDWGVETGASWNSSSIPFSFHGYYTAGPGGFDLLGAREYDPATGQFVSVDPLLSLTDQRYSYANDDPIDGVDPSGSDCEELPVSSVAAEGEAAETVAPDLENLDAKTIRRMEQRGWTPEQIQEAYANGEQVNAVNKATGGAATRYINPATGQSVVIDNATGQVIHVGGPGFRYGPESGDVP